tara:strand:- start:37 stop:498 length:462 start_codon:yes stop_codon:yes gene_type:complete
MNKNLIITICIFAIFINNNVFADEINIISEKLHVDRNKSISVFTGKVHAWNDNFEIWSEKLITEFNEGKKDVKKIIAENQVKIIKDEMIITGSQGIYDPIENKINVIGKIMINNNGNIIYCDELTLDLENSVSIMKSSKSKKVEAIILMKEKL